jgi:hypothetical protein
VTRLQRYTDLISIEVVHTLNAALCEHHLKRCAPSDELLEACSEVASAYEATRAAVREMDAMMACADANEVRALARWFPPACTCCPCLPAFRLFAGAKPARRAT